MTRARAIVEAEKLLDRIAAELGSYPAKVFLADYDSDDTLRFLSPEAGWPLEFHRQVLNVLKERLARKNIVCEIRVLTKPDYLSWLAEAGINNSQIARSIYVAGVTPAMARDKLHEKS